jgi:signal transduction histidine kinase
MGLFAERLSSPGSLQPGDRPSPDQRLTEIRQTHDQLRRHLQLRRQQLVNQIAVASQEADRFLLIVLASAMLLIAVLSVRIPQVIDRRVRALVHATKELEAGHYRPGSRDYPEDEFGNLAQAFDRMALALEEKKEQLQQSYKALEGVNKNLEAMVQERTGQLRAAQDELIKREKLAMLGTLAGAIGHELRNPLSVMATSVYFLEKVIANADGKIKKHLDMLTHQISAANRIITNLLDFARSKEPTREEADMNTMVQEVIQRSAIPKTVHLHVNLGSGPSKVWLDPSQVNQVILNLVSNAVQSMPRGGQLGVEVNRVNGSVELRVADSGCGISEEDQRRIFQPLFTTKQKGIGLGLAVSRKIVEANGGQIGFDSVPGQGTTFKLRFPVFEPAADTRAASMS